MLWQLFTLRLACFHGNMVLAHTNVSTPETTLALIFEQFTLQYEQQSSGMSPELTLQNIHQLCTKLKHLKGSKQVIGNLQLWLTKQKKKGLSLNQAYSRVVNITTPSLLTSAI